MRLSLCLIIYLCIEWASVCKCLNCKCNSLHVRLCCKTFRYKLHMYAWISIDYHWINWIIPWIFLNITNWFGEHRHGPCITISLFRNKLLPLCCYVLLHIFRCVHTLKKRNGKYVCCTYHWLNGLYDLVERISRTKSLIVLPLLQKLFAKSFNSMRLYIVQFFVCRFANNLAWNVNFAIAVINNLLAHTFWLQNISFNYLSNFLVRMKSTT